jgi:hypothetical protein
MDLSTLAKVKTNYFPDVKFKSGSENIVVVNGHHRMQVLTKINEIISAHCFTVQQGKKEG